MLELKKYIVEQFLNGNVFHANFLTWAYGGDFFLSFFFFEVWVFCFCFVLKKLLEKMELSWTSVHGEIQDLIWIM